MRVGSCSQSTGFDLANTSGAFPLALVRHVSGATNVAVRLVVVGGAEASDEVTADACQREC